MRMLIAAAVSSVALFAFAPLSVHALNTWGTDMSDLWWNPNESGWGANLAHQQEIIFMTLFVYGQDNRVRWYVADALRSQGAGSDFTFSGALYETTGPFLGGAFNPANVGNRQVGTATVSLGVETGTLQYSVDGFTVAKSIERQTFRANNLAGSYVGAASATASGCGTSSGSLENSASFTISHVGSAVAIAAVISNGVTCTYSGTYTQTGRMGRIDGSLSCSTGGRGTFRALEIEASYLGFLTRYTADYGGGCTEIGRIGGLKR